MTVGEYGGVDFFVREEAYCFFEAILINVGIVVLFSKNCIETVGNNRFRAGFFDEFRFIRQETVGLIGGIRLNSDTDGIFAMFFRDLLIALHLITNSITLN